MIDPFDEYLDRLVAAVADGMTVDWAEAELRAKTPEQRDMLRQLQVLTAIEAAANASVTTGMPDGEPLQSAAGRFGAGAAVCDDGRFLIERALGKGGFGIVYKAYDRQRRAHVALKAFTRQTIDSISDFKNEFRLLADLAHPNLVSLYELFSDGRSWFIAMELVPGIDFISYVRSGASSSHVDVNPSSDKRPCRCNLARLGPAMIQLSQALAYLHGAGKLHCDIKPSNVLVTADGQLKLLDFGLATDVTQIVTDRSQKVRGTPAYVAPEQVAGQRPTGASDWYGVGVMLFEALTGERPFDSTVSQVLTDKQHKDAPPPGTLCAGIPELLNELCCRLLARDPDLRPSDAEVLSMLRQIWPTATMANHPPAVRLDRIPLVGRQAELGCLDRAFDRSTAGRLELVLLHGASGMGKSFLVRRFLQRLRARRPDAVVLEGRCSERESVPYKGLDSLVDQLAEYLATLAHKEVQHVLPRDCTALAKLFPVLRRVEAIELGRRLPRAEDVQELRRRATAAFRDLLERVAAGHPLVLVIDDLQWTDADSAMLLDELLFDGAPWPVLFIGCHRTEEAVTHPVLHALLSKAQRAAASGHCALNTVVVSELSRGEAEELVRALAGGGDTESLVDPIVTESGRSPLFIHQLVQYATSVAGASPATSWQGSSPGGALTLDSVIRARTDNVGPGARQLLEVLALYGGPLALSLVEEVADLGGEALGHSVALRAARLARSRLIGADEKLEIYHDRIREAIVADLDPLELRGLHGRLAIALERMPDTDPDALAHHFHGAGQSELAAKYAVLAGDRASELLAFDRAVRSYRFALEFGRFEDGGRAVRTKLGDALAASGRGYDAAQAYLSAAAVASSTEALDLQRRAAEQLLQSGHLDEGLAVVADVLTRAGLRFPRTPRRALLSLLMLRARIALRGLEFVEREERTIPPEALVGVDTCWSVTTGLAIVDHIRSAEFGARNLLLALNAGEPLRIVRALAMELAYTSIAGASAEKYNAKLIAIAERLVARVPNPEARALLTLATGSAAYMQGRWTVARELCEGALQMLREQCTRVAWQIDTAQFFTLLSLYYEGEIAELSRRLPVLLKEARERDARYAETTMRTRISYVSCLADGDVEGAETAIRQGMERWSQKGFHNQHYYEMVASAETDLFAGRGAKAWSDISAKWRDLRRTLLLRVQPVFIESYHLRARAALAAAFDPSITDSQREGLIRSARRDADRIRRTRAPWAAGLADLVLSGAATLRGAPQQSIAHLETAETVFDRANMQLFLAIARRRRGELIGGAEGESLVDAANTWMRNQSLRNPDGFTQMLAPGDFRRAVRPTYEPQ